MAAVLVLTCIADSAALFYFLKNGHLARNAYHAAMLCARVVILTLG